MTSNYQFDLDLWMNRFPLEESYGRYSGDDITSPCDLCNNEWLRKEMKDAYDWGEAVPTDVFVMADGEPDIRSATKIGGLPYRPANEPFPVTQDGKILSFIAQFNFSDSVDIVGKQPGDILLVFATNDEGYFDNYHFEWRNIEDNPDLDLVDTLPKSLSPITPCYGYRCRTSNFPNAEQKNIEGDYPHCKNKEVWSDYWLLQYQATQIGKSSFEPQGDNSTQQLCTIASVQPDSHKPFPWVNVPEPLCKEDEWAEQGDYLMIGDLGCIFISYDEDGELTASEQCY